jgi:hypothetical protein
VVSVIVAGQARDMTAILIVGALVVLGALAAAATWFRSDPHDDVNRFHHAREITSSWSSGYAAISEPEQPEASEDKPELQHSVHLVDA